jgi:hypothetical protein
MKEKDWMQMKYYDWEDKIEMESRVWIIVSK